ncbi:hypothetical protein GCM10011579_006950 [Streptomyces albiflavescens]|uniref:Uncharacterized protein n=1 Tax=Streptomyces albiflavescens TaxID=1623582 RepID=A0A917XRZ6_9ACTN|nr:hypothetical protein GCM10011579_006950 [Streptomyces albiflavescens]
MSPPALRRRMAHGGIYKPDKVDAALSNYFQATWRRGHARAGWAWNASWSGRKTQTWTYRSETTWRSR